ncbi:MAG: hypothetical protein NTX40_09995 [Planctomycetota bacterium]|nr:hypothetical protein [Planctomycetota bacterium]
MMRIVVLVWIVGLLVVLPTAATAAEDGGFIMVDAKRKTADAKWTPQKTVTLEHLAGFVPPKTVRLNPFGGRADRKVPAAGFFRARQVDGRWWLVDPAGSLFYSVGCCSVSRNGMDNGKAALCARFGTDKQWAQATAALLAQNGFNTLGCWSDWQAFQSEPLMFPYTTQLNFMSSYAKERGRAQQATGHVGFTNDCILVFEPEFETFCNERARKMIAPLKDDPYLLGHFSDNELPFPSDAIERFLRLDAADPNRRAAQAWLDARAGAKDPNAFLEYLVETYYRIVSRAIRQADPNHLFLGSRLHGSDLGREPVFRAAGKFADVLSVNYYGAWTPDNRRMADWVRWSGKPFLITEWYAKGMDSGLPNNSGAGWTVRTQADRGQFYQNFTLGLLAQSGCVGWHWFKYMDNDPTNTHADPSNRDSNKGIVSSTYEPYPDLLKMMRELNQQAYPLMDFFDARAPAQGK